MLDYCLGVLDYCLGRLDYGIGGFVWCKACTDLAEFLRGFQSCLFILRSHLILQVYNNVNSHLLDRRFDH